MVDLKEKYEFTIPIKESMMVEKDFMIRGIAINATTTRNGITYTAEELKKAAPSLMGKPILKDHENSVDNIVGKVTMCGYNEQAKCIEFEGKIMDEKCKEMISNGLIGSVSIGAMVAGMDEVEVDEGNGQVTCMVCPKGIEFVELSLVAVPADPNANFAKAMYESYNKVKATKEEAKLKEQIDIKNIEEVHKMEVETLKKEVAEIKESLKQEKAPEPVQTTPIAPVVIEKVVEVVKESPKVEENPEVKLLKESVEKLTKKIEEMEKSAVQLKGKIDCEVPKIAEEFRFEESSHGIAIWKEELDAKMYPRLVR